jgi:hypothetical protein
MSNELKTFDVKRFAVIIGVMPAVSSGLSSADDAIQFKRNEDSFTDQAGLTGEVVRSRQYNKSGEVILKVMKTSMLNDYLSGLHQLDMQSGGGVIPILAKHYDSLTTLGASYAWIKKPPDYSIGKEVGDVEWTLRCADLDMFIAGQEILQ